jgi:Spy/CpxP family protein refolding chaperone
MRPENRTFAAMLVATVVAAGLAGWLGVEYGVHHKHTADLDSVLHHELALSRDQDRKLDALEADFAVKRHVYEAQMRAANSDLAAAMTRDHAYGSSEQQAIEQFHKAMMALQEETVRHVLAMRSVLTPDQARSFDAIVAKNLAGPSS